MPMKPPLASIQSLSSTQRACLTLLICVVFAGLGGCSRGPSEDHFIKALESAETHDLAVSSRSLSSLKAVEVVKGEQWSVEFSCEDVPAEPWFESVNVESEVQARQPQQKMYLSALEELRSLRKPENVEPSALSREISRVQIPPLFRERFAAGQPVTWHGSGTLKKRGDEYRLILKEISFPENSDHERLLNQSKVGINAAIADGSETDPLHRYFSMQKKLISSVDKAKLAMQARLKQEHSKLSELLSEQWMLEGSISLRNAGPLGCQIVIEQQNDRISAALIDEQDPFSRVVFSGALALAPPGQDPHDGWHVALNNADQHLSRLARSATRQSLLYYDSFDQKFRFNFAQLSTATVQVTEGAKPSASEVALGTVMSGNESVDQESDRGIDLTVVAYNTETNDIRLTLEDQQTPFTFAVFEGKLRTEAPHHLGMPVQLKRIDYAEDKLQASRKSGVFGRYSKSPLFMVQDNGQWMGICGESRLKFKTVQQADSIVPARQRWMAAFQQGTTWSGTMRWRDEAVEQVHLRVADVANDGGYVRVSMQKKDDPFQFVIYEGSLALNDGRADGYGLSLTQTGNASYTDREYYGVFFSSWETDDKKLFRLSADGQTLTGITTEGQQVTLTKDVDQSPSSHQDDPAGDWQLGLAVGKTWTGTLFDRDRKQTAKVELQVKSSEFDGGKIQVEIRLVEKRSIKADYEGSLSLDKGAINGYALSLKNIGGTKTKSIVISDLKGFPLEFRLDATGTRLLGRTPYGTSSTMAIQPAEFEYLDLRLTQ